MRQSVLIPLLRDVTLFEGPRSGRRKTMGPAVVRALFFLLTSVMAASCMTPVVAPTVPTPPASVVPVSPAPTAPSPPAVDQIYRETGIASWYGRELQGRKTASGETFDLNGLSAAHRTLPLGTTIRVTNLDNFKSLTVKVNDRGPFAKGRVVELSLGAARELGFVEQGTVRVKIETLEPLRNGGQYTVQAAIFTEEENAKMLKDRLSKKFEVVTTTSFESNLGKFYRVRVGSYGTEEKAETIAGKLTLEGLEPIVLRKD